MFVVPSRHPVEGDRSSVCSWRQCLDGHATPGNGGKNRDLPTVRTMGAVASTRPSLRGRHRPLTACRRRLITLLEPPTCRRQRRPSLPRRGTGVCHPTAACCQGVTVQLVCPRLVDGLLRAASLWHLTTRSCLVSRGERVSWSTLGPWTVSPALIFGTGCPFSWGSRERHAETRTGLGSAGPASGVPGTVSDPPSPCLRAGDVP